MRCIREGVYSIETRRFYLDFPKCPLLLLHPQEGECYARWFMTNPITYCGDGLLTIKDLDLMLSSTVINHSTHQIGEMPYTHSPLIHVVKRTKIAADCAGGVSRLIGRPIQGSMGTFHAKELPKVNQFLVTNASGKTKPH